MFVLLFLLAFYLTLTSSANTTLAEPDITALSPAANGLESISSSSCQPNPVLNALLLQMLMSSLAQTPQLQLQQQQLPQLNRNLNELLPPVLSTVPIRTTLITSSVVSTVTQRLSTIVSIWFRNVRIPTTIYSNRIRLVTDLITVTSTLHVEPTFERNKREFRDQIHLDSSMLDMQTDEQHYYSTQQLTDQSTLPHSDRQLMSAVMQPRVLEAWNNFLRVLEETADDSETN